MKSATHNIPPQRVSTGVTSHGPATKTTAVVAVKTQSSSYPHPSSAPLRPASVAPNGDVTVDFTPTAATASVVPKELNTLYELHHRALHRYLELGWTVHWGYHDASPFAPKPTTASSSSGADSPAGSRATMTPRRSGGAQPSSTGCITSSSQCPLCAEESALRQNHNKSLSGDSSVTRRARTPRGGSATSPTGRAALVSTQPLPERIDSLRRWIETYAHSRERPALRACLPFLSTEAIEYLARLGLRTGWILTKLYVELPKPSASATLAAGEEDVTAAIAFHCVPCLFDLEEVASNEVATLLSLPRFSSESTVSTRSPGAHFTASNARFFRWRRCVEVSRRRLQAASGSALLLGDLCACDVLLALAPQSDSERLELTVWGRTHRRERHGTATRAREHQSSDAPAVSRRQEEGGVGGGAGVGGGGTPPAADELFFLARSLDDYWRLGSAFGWVYGWQLAYSARGPPQRSLVWLRFFNPSALKAALALHQVGVCTDGTNARTTATARKV